MFKIEYNFLDQNIAFGKEVFNVFFQQHVCYATDQKEIFMGLDQFFVSVTKTNDLRKDSIFNSISTLGVLSKIIFLACKELKLKQNFRNLNSNYGA